MSYILHMDILYLTSLCTSCQYTLYVYVNIYCTYMQGGVLVRRMLTYDDVYIYRAVFWVDDGDNSQKVEALMHRGDTDSRLPAFFLRDFFFRGADAPRRHRQRVASNFFF